MTKELFIPVTLKEKIVLAEDILAQLPEKIGLVGTTQFTNQLPNIKEQLEKAGKQAFVEKGFQPQPGQLLGCDVSAAKHIAEKVDAFLYIGDGQFHPIGLGLLNLKVFCYDPYPKKFYELDLSHIQGYEKKVKGAVLKFLHSDHIGVLVSMKKGQANMGKALRLKERLEKKEKSVYIFLYDTLNFLDLENFNFIECYVNTSCPRIMDDFDKFEKPVVNFQDIIPVLTEE